MAQSYRLIIFATAVLLSGLPALAAGQIQGAGSGSTGGSIEGKTNENSTMTRTGAANGSEAVQSTNPQAGAGTGDNAVLTAPREAKPGTAGTSQPSSLNGQNP